MGRSPKVGCLGGVSRDWVRKILVDKVIGNLSYRTYGTIFQDELGQILLKNELLRLLVFDEIEKVIVKWVPN